MDISASILNVEEENSIQTFYRLELAHTDYYHIDVMDGEFVENNTIDKMKIYSDNLKNITNIPLEVHLMVKDIKKYIDIFAPCNPSIIYFHIEAVKKENIKEIINYIKEANCRVGIAINPETEITEIYNYLQYIHNILIMSVNPGKGGQKFIQGVLTKIKELKEYIHKNNYENEIEVDGGINEDTAKQIKESGADIAVVGTFLINSKDYKYTVEKIKSI